MSYFSKWKRGSQPTIVNQRARSQSLDVEALERSGIRTLQNVSDANSSLILCRYRKVVIVIGLFGPDIVYDYFKETAFS